MPSLYPDWLDPDPALTVDPFVAAVSKPKPATRFVVCHLCGGSGTIETGMTEQLGDCRPCRYCDKGWIEVLA